MSEWTLEKGRFAAVAGPVVVAVLDGVGLGPQDEGNAVWLARTPTLDGLFESCSWVSLAAHGTAVGLPSDEDMGNSEVGHNALGCGRVVAQGARLVNEALQTGALFEGDTWKWLIEGVRASGEALHLIGLLSDGNVHSHEAHLHQLIEKAATQGVKRLRVHILLDGRDVPETSALTYVDRLEEVLARASQAKGRDYRIASGGGRMRVTMDRYQADWAMVERGWQLHVRGEGRRFATAREAVSTLREEDGGVIDQFLPGFVIAGDDGPVGPIRDGASVVFFNFRGDRALEITRAFEEDGLTAFDRGARPAVRYAGMMQYDGDLRLPSRFLVEPPAIDRTVGEYLAHNGISQLAVSETQKFGHVTYFWNGNRTGAFDPDTEVYVELPSDNLPFEQRPWMKAAEIVDATLAALKAGSLRHARINLANGDMVGHTGNREATILSVSAVDLCLGRLLKGVKALGGVVLVTADHGNADEMYERKKDGSFSLGDEGRPRARTSHSLNPVPLILYDPHEQVAGRLARTVDAPGLANVTATMVELLGFAPPEVYLPSLLEAQD